ncbi:MAG: hypothetical protein VX899_27705 [Myxococcota bacterium]|nr:hypothetical protein [Myxococcota bacterium]
MLILLATLLSPAALAQESRNLYQENPALTEGKLEDFRELYVDAEAFAGQVAPKEAADGIGKLVVYNRTSSPMDLYVNGVKVGMMHPATPAILHGLKAGTYEVKMIALNAFTTTKMVSTVAEDAPVTEMGQAAEATISRPVTLVEPPQPPPAMSCYLPEDADEGAELCAATCPEETECEVVVRAGPLANPELFESLLGECEGQACARSELMEAMEFKSVGSGNSRR